jgi:hypothetical protein
VTNQVGVSWIDETCGLAAVDSLSEGVMEEGILHIELLNRPMYTIRWNGWHITRGTQPERRLSHLESHCYNKLDPGPKTPASPNLDERKSFLVCSKPYLTSPSIVYISSTPYSLVRIHHRVILHRFLCSPSLRKSRDEVSFKGEGCNAPCYRKLNQVI